HLQEAACRLRDEHSATVGGKEQNAILEMAENLVKIVFERGEDLLDVAHALPDLLDFGGHSCGRVLACARGRVFLGSAAARSPVIELHADLFEGAQGEVAEQERNQ